jgi:hypothetical protein
MPAAVMRDSGDGSSIALMSACRSGDMEGSAGMRPARRPTMMVVAPSALRSDTGTPLAAESRKRVEKT